MRKPHHRSAQVWHALSRDHTVLPATRAFIRVWNKAYLRLPYTQPPRCRVTKCGQHTKRKVQTGATCRHRHRHIFLHHRVLIMQYCRTTANKLTEWLSRNLTSHSTHYRSFRGQLLQARVPTNSFKSLEEARWLSRSDINAQSCNHITISTTLRNRLNSQRKSPSVTKPNLLDL